MGEELQKVFKVNGRPAFQAVRLLGQGGSSRCYQVRKILEDGGLGRFYVVKEFFPRALAAFLEAPDDGGPVRLKAGCGHVRDEFEAMRRIFSAEPALCAAINQAAGDGGNFPWVFHSEKIRGRDDLLLIDTENGYTVDEFVKRQRREVMSRQYVTLCLTVVCRLLEALRDIHRGMLHLDIKPQNVYIVTQDTWLSPDSAFSVKLLDLASAVPKERMTREGFSDPSWRWENPTVSDGYTDPVLPQLCEAAENGTLEMFWRRHAVDERADWYAAGAVLYSMLTGCDGVREGQTYISLPHTGMLEDDGFRSDLEETLSRALRFSPYTAREIPEHPFLQDVRRLLLLARHSVLPQKEDAPSAKPAAPEIAVSAEDSPLPESCGLLDALLKKDGDSFSAEVRRFSEGEQAAYQSQAEVLCRCLPDSADQLTCYTNHAVPHVQEVMDETEKLFAALRPWLSGYVSSGEMETVYRRLMLAAKLHDIGMAGTPEGRALLNAIDRLYYLLDNAGYPPERIGEDYARLTALAHAARLETPWLGAVIHTLPDGTPAVARKLKKALSAYHDAVKTAFRNQHAEVSGRFILAHRDEEIARYGAADDWAEIALLAALHSNAVRDHIDAKALNASLSREYCQSFLRAYGAPGDAERLCGDSGLKRIFAEATVLRLADARRSGSRLCMLDGAPVQVDRTPGGRPILMQARNGIREPLPIDRSREILLSEACCDFGGVELSGNGQSGWRLTHFMQVRCCENEAMRSLFRDLRVPAYISELSSALLMSTQKLSHVFQVEAVGVDAAAAEAWAKTFRLPPGYAIVFRPKEA